MAKRIARGIIAGLVASTLLWLFGCASAPLGGVWHYPEDPAAKVRIYKLGTSKRADQLIHWTEHYADKMGLQRPRIIFQDLPNGWCGHVFLGTPDDPIIAYELSKRCQFSITARTAARHEMCHHRLGHVQRLALDPKLETHPEVETCMAHYK